MKKLFYLILGVLLFMPFLVKADSAPPDIIPYQVTPIDRNGAPIYIWDDDNEVYVKTERKFAYGKVIDIIYDFDNDYISVDENDDNNRDYVKVSDLTTVLKNYKVNEKNLLQPENSLVLKQVDIKKGPAAAYESTGKSIPANTKIKTRKFNYYYEDEKVRTSWVYVEYEGTKGFIDTEESVVFGGTYTNIICYKDSIIKNIEETKILAEIKANTKFNAMIYERDEFTDGYYIEYGDVKGIIDDDILVKRKTITVKALKDIKVYKELKYAESDDQEDDSMINVSEVVTTIKKGTSFKLEYYDWVDVSYYENGNVKGWFYEKDDSGDFIKYAYSKNNKIVAVEKGKDDANSSAVTILETPKNIEGNEEEKQKEEPGDGGTPYTGPESGGSSKAPSQTKPTKKNKTVPTLVYYCLGAAVVVSLTAVVTILLVNKKKKVNTEEVKEENHITEEKQDEKVDI